MSPALVILALFGASAVLWALELMLPTQGVLGALGIGAILAAIVEGFRVNQWVGLAMLISVVIASPLVITLAINFWPKTFVGRRMVLPHVHSLVTPPHVGIGQTGVTVSELRPMGWCEFDQQRFEVKSEIGLIPAGMRIKVVSITNGKLIVRPT